MNRIPLYRIAAVVVSVAMYAGVAHAATAEGAGADCAAATRQGDMNACAAQAYARSDASLNRSYGELMQKLPAGRKAGLREVQRAWLRYRDLHCGFAAAGYAGGSMQPMVKSNCLAAVTETRAGLLRELLEEASR